MGYKNENSAYTNESEKKVENVIEEKKVENVVAKKKVENFIEEKKVEEEDVDINNNVRGEVIDVLSRQVVMNDSKEEYVVESYDDDREYREYVNQVNQKRNESSVGGLQIGILDVIENLNNRLMYLEYNNEMSYEEDKNDYIDYNRILRLLRN